MLAGLQSSHCDAAVLESELLAEMKGRENVWNGELCALLQEAMIKGNVFEPAAARCSAPLLVRIICSNNNIDNGAKKIY